MRLTEHQYVAICDSFRKFFFEGDTLWLFGSRVDDAKRGGDIDLYIETVQRDPRLACAARTSLSCEIQRLIGEQKIDIVLNLLSSETELPIYEKARSTGLLLVKKETTLQHHMRIADLHASRLERAVQEVQRKMPLITGFSRNIPIDDIAPLDMMAMRYNKLQDLIGSKIFPLILEIMGEEVETLIDKLNKLEKLGYLKDVNWWLELRKLRNKITHEYADDDLVIATTIGETLRESERLLIYWGYLKEQLIRIV